MTMIPLVGEVKELAFVKRIVVDTADEEIASSGIEMHYEVGTMIEIPRAALTADEIAKEAEFFCFGTNDLTQMTYGFSRDDAGKFLKSYYDTKIMSNYHLRDKELSLKAKGLLSQMLSLPDDWDYTLAGLSHINRESKDAIRSAVNELEAAGYIRRHQKTDASGKFSGNEYVIHAL